MARVPQFTRLVIALAVVFAALLMLPPSAAFAAPVVVAIYRGDAPAASGTGRRIERGSADGK